MGGGGGTDPTHTHTHTDGGVYISDIDPNWKERCYLETHTHWGGYRAALGVRHEPINNFPPFNFPFRPFFFIF